jgi:hypothetical protein
MFPLSNNRGWRMMYHIPDYTIVLGWFWHGLTLSVGAVVEEVGHGLAEFTCEAHLVFVHTIEAPMTPGGALNMISSRRSSVSVSAFCPAVLEREVNLRSHEMSWISVGRENAAMIDADAFVLCLPDTNWVAAFLPPGRAFQGGRKGQAEGAAPSS